MLSLLHFVYQEFLGRLLILDSVIPTGTQDHLQTCYQVELH